MRGVLTLSTIGRALAHALNASGMSQDDLARAVGVSQPTVSRWVTGENEPSSDMLNKMAGAMGRPIVVTFGAPTEKAAPSTRTERLISAVERMADELARLATRLPPPAEAAEILESAEQSVEQLEQLRRGSPRTGAPSSGPRGTSGRSRRPRVQRPSDSPDGTGQ